MNNLQHLLERPKLPTEPINVTGEFLDAVKDLAPGQVLKMKGRGDDIIAILHWEDLEHILIAAGMRPDPTTADKP